MLPFCGSKGLIGAQHTLWSKPNLVVDEEALDQNLRVVPLGRGPQLLVLELVPPPLVVPDPQKRNFHSSQKFVFVILVLVVDGQLQHVVNVLHVAGTRKRMIRRNRFPN